MGPPNAPKDGIGALAGVIETDWSPFTFTMNWKFTRSQHWVRFEEGEPICFFFPVGRNTLESITPRFADIDSDPDLKAKFAAWDASRSEFHARRSEGLPTEKWQKHYFRGVTLDGCPGVPDHRTKLRLAPFEPAIEPNRFTGSLPSLANENAPSEPASGAAHLASIQLAKRDWLLDVIESHRQLGGDGIDRLEGLTTDEFFEQFYKSHRPVVLGGELADWPALTLWTPEYLANKVGSAPIEYQGGRTEAPDYEVRKHDHRRTMPFDDFVRMITAPGSGNSAYLTAYNFKSNHKALAPLRADVRPLSKFLDPESPDAAGQWWIGPAATFTPLHHDLTNNLVAQVKGRKQVLLAPAADVGKLYNHLHMFSEVRDLQDAQLNLNLYPQLKDARLYEVLLEPGDALFIPIGWWHQVRALDFSVTITYVNFRWRNDWHLSYPQELEGIHFRSTRAR
ncbi:cupin-like domain-containing protein [Phenylobacterium sp. J426]|uniref:DUF6065 family protein n=1 Tax=Phenylobacterium sp. J426 TaxID=2898439 RepID=UPI0035B3EAFC|nr:cupin-like domain-containing protein [Phenylobacterium sp. J426]